VDKLFIQIINMSITSCYVILFVIIARLLLKKAPKVFSYALWFAVLFRLICPFSLESMFSLLPINTQAVPYNIMYSETPQIYSGIPVIDQAVNNSLPAPVIGDSVSPMQIWITLGKIIWLIGIGTLLIYSIFTTIRLSNRLKSATTLYANICEADSIKTPFVFGIICPKIYLPTGLSETEKSYIIEHEETHIKRFDHIIKFLSFLVLSIHWFNPLVWVAYFLMSKDMELSCDEAVIEEMGYGIKKEYSNSLLSLAVGRKIVGGSPLAFSEDDPKGRIRNILNYKKPKFWVVLIGFMIIIAASVGLLSNPQSVGNGFKQSKETSLLLPPEKDAEVSYETSSLIYQNDGSTSYSLGGVDSIFTFYNDMLSIKDGEQIRTFQISYDETPLTVENFQKQFRKRDKIPDISSYSNLSQYNLCPSTDELPGYRLYVLDGHYWIGTLYVTSVWRIVSIDIDK